jgi:hypothetical protein
LADITLVGFFPLAADDLFGLVFVLITAYGAPPQALYPGISLIREWRGF